MKSSTPRLSEAARHVVVPSGVVSTGWPSVRDKCRDLGITFQLWQDGAGQVILAKRTDGKYAASVGGVVISIPRQVGKTFLLGGIVFALSLLFPNLTVLWTAHRLRTANETFMSMQGFALRKKIKPYVAKIVRGSGEEEIRFKNGSRILFGARERGFGLGFAEVDVLVFDEAQRLTEAAIDDMVPATNQSRQAAGALLLFTGTPPRPADPGEVFRRKRSECLSGEDEDTAYIEFSADRDANPDDWRQVAKANPSYPKYTPREAIKRMRKNLGTESYMREGLGIWYSGAAWEVVDESMWSVLTAPAAAMADPVAFGVWVSPDRDRAAIAAAGGFADGHLVEITGRDSVGLDARSGVDWLTVRLDALAEHRPLVVVTNDRVLADAGRGRLATGPDQAAASALLYDSVRAADVHHLGQQELTRSAAGAIKRVVGQGWVWDVAAAEVDVCPVGAASLALWGLLTPRVHEKRSSIPMAVYA